MKTTTILLLSLTSLTPGLFAQAPRYEVLQIVAKTVEGDTTKALRQTNSFSIRQFEVAELVSYPISNAEYTTIRVETPKGSIEAWRLWNGMTVSSFDPLIVPGEAKISLEAFRAYAVFKITPEHYPVEKTSIVPPGPGGAEVELQCSVDLVHWVTATNGTFTNLPAAKFFRVDLKRISP